ncbi:putative HC-toxin efflux carrier TOXA 11 [Colletotrichum chlorophyti]|uniref:Putative HC-toxin efflux carrier TOXA 11 n=1 Tax=Colletotrichum chlorophyti TaxID=708187 RepID=A0A1Q8RGJ7_9PEZI|nr:putative HC-toxin efflux carrier TOXA 11 [Colletotrichum chlorophyti]
MSAATSTEKAERRAAEACDQSPTLSTSGMDIHSTESDSANNTNLKSIASPTDNSAGKGGKSAQKAVAIRTAIPRITAEFNSLEDAGLYRSASLVASTALQLPFGKAYALFNVKWIYLSSLVIFEAGSIICAAAPNSRALIAGRAVSGVGAAALYSGAINILAMAASPQRAPALFGIVSSMVGLASLVGPPLGGAFTDAPSLTWRWCFWINLPFGGAAAICILLLFRTPQSSPPPEMDTEMQTVCQTRNATQDVENEATPTTPQLSNQNLPATVLPFRKKMRKMDPLGTSLLIPAMVSLILALQWGGTKYSWSDGRVWGCLICSGVLLVAFVVSLWINDDQAIIPPRLLRERAVLGGVLLISWLSAALFTHIFFLPFYFQVVQGMSARGSGLCTLAYLGGMALAGLIAGGAMSSRGVLSHHRPYAWVGAGLFVVGAGLMHMLVVDSGLGVVVGFQLLSGVALGVAWQVPFVAVQRSDKTKRSGDTAVANALIAFSNSFGATLGISIAQNIFSGTLARGLAALPGLDSGQVDALAKAGQAAQLRDPGFMPPELLSLVLQVFNRAITSTKHELENETKDESEGPRSATTEVDLEATNENDDDSNEERCPSLTTISLLTFGLCLVVFAAAVDNTILATAIPKITDDFDSLEDAGWYRSSYLVASTALQLSLGKLYSHLSVKWTYLAGLVIFEVGSIVCALAPRSAALIAGRTIAGVGGAALSSGGMNILALVAPMRLRPLLFSALTSMLAVASLIGPPLGGVFTDSQKLTWRWCFWINLPLGSVAFAVVLLVFRGSANKTHAVNNASMNRGEVDASGIEPPPNPPLTSWYKKIAKFDPIGTVLLIPTIVSLLLALQWGGIKYPWADPRVWGCLLCFGLLTISLVITQARLGDNATVPLRILKLRSVFAGALQMATISAAMFTHMFFLPFYFQIILGTSATGSGLRTLPYVTCMAISGIVAGGLMTRTESHRPFGWCGSAIFVIGSGLLYTLHFDSSTAAYVGYQLVASIGAGAAFQVPYIAVQQACAKGKKLSPSDVPIANALMSFFNSLGASLGISIAQNVFSSTLFRQLASIPGIQPGQIERIANIGTGASLRESGIISPNLLRPVLEAYNFSIVSTFIVAVVFGGLSFLASLISD